MIHLLSIKNKKTEKSQDYGYLTGILHLKPNKIICPWCSPGCFKACLNTSGFGRYPRTQSARERRTRLYLNNKEMFCEFLAEDVESICRSAERKGLKPAIRLNGTSDIVWFTFIRQFTGIQFYDYTKNPALMVTNPLPNYDLTFSVNEENEGVALNLLELGHRIAVVFHEIPKKWKGYEVIDGDRHDLRFLDPKGIVIGLEAKGKAKHYKTGFVK